MKKYSIFIGRWQPFHEGHVQLIRKVYDEGKNILIMCRLTPVDNENPYTYEERRKMIREVFQDQDRVKIMPIPDLEEICIGRKVGYNIREIKLSEDIEAISGTKTREKLRKEGKL